MKTAFLFPGQGAQAVGMGREFYDSFASARAVFDEADRALCEPLTRLVFEGPREELSLTANTQPAVLAASVAALRAFGEKCDVTPDIVAGHSLGEYSALVAAGAMKFSDAVLVTRARGKFMQEAVPVGQGAMAAIIGDITIDDIEAACRDNAGDDVVSPANLNAPGQVVISGNKAAVERASNALTQKGAKVIPLAVSAPFHSPLMKPAAVRLDETLSKIVFTEPRIPIVTNVEAKPNTNASRMRELLVRQVTAPVRWIESMKAMLNDGIETFIEFGPGNVLAGLLKKIEPSAKVVSVNSAKGIDKAMEILEKL